MRQLHLLIADLFPPPGFLEPGLPRPRTPALAALLARGRPSPGLDAGAGLADALGLLFHLAPGQGAAPYRLAAEGISPGDGGWLCLDPVHLGFHQDHLYVAPGESFPLERAEADALVATLNDHFAAEGWHCLAPHPRRWYLGLPAAPGVVTCPLDAAVGRRVEPHLPRGTDAPVWRRLLTEVQMLLHVHPVNGAREAAGLPPINSVWPWGGGVWRTLPAGPWREMWSELPLAVGLAAAAGVSWRNAPAAFRDWSGGDGTWLGVDDRLSAAAGRGDPTAWLTALEALEADWLGPALTALRLGRLDRLVLHGTGEGSRGVELTPLAAWRWWRRG